MNVEINRLLDFEMGRLSRTEEIALFQELLDSGDIDNLNSFYKKKMTMMVTRGIVKNKVSYSYGDVRE